MDKSRYKENRVRVEFMQVLQPQLSTIKKKLSLTSSVKQRKDSSAELRKT